MANSFSFNGTDLADHGLVITTSRANILSQLVSYVQLKDRGYSSGIKREPKSISLDIAILGASHADINTNIDNIKKTITTETDGELVLDVLPGRYFNAQLESFDGDYEAPAIFVGVIGFICVDPLGYSTGVETSHNHPINEAPFTTVPETTTGTGMVNPVYTLNAEQNLTNTIMIENLNTGEELRWTGSLTPGQKLIIDVPGWIVKKEGDASMATVTGQFPRLQSGANQIKVTNFGTTGSLDITYRNNYL